MAKVTISKERGSLSLDRDQLAEPVVSAAEGLDPKVSIEQDDLVLERNHPDDARSPGHA